MAVIATQNTITTNSNFEFDVPLDRDNKVKPFIVVFRGTFDTSSNTVEFSVDGGTSWVDSGETAVTAEGFIQVNNPNGLTKWRAVTASVGASTDLDVTVHA